MDCRNGDGGGVDVDVDLEDEFLSCGLRSSAFCRRVESRDEVELWWWFRFVSASSKVD